MARHTQNLPGLFSTQDLENTYSTGSTILSGENAARLKSIQDFLDAYETNLIIKIENQRFSESIQAPTISFDVGSQILNYSNLSTIDLNSLISSFYQGDTSSQTTLKDKIIEGTKTFANYIEGQKNKRTGNSFILNKFGKELLDDVRNGSADNMFKTDEALNRTLQFLSLVYKVRTAFQNIKQQLLISG